MANVVGKITVNTQSTQTPATLPGTNTPLTVQQALGVNFGASGTAADAVDLKYTATLALAAAAQTIDLTSLTDVYGGTVNFARVRSITVWMRSVTNGQTLTISGGATNPWAAILNTTGTLTMQASSANNQAVLALTAPNTTGWVTSGTSKTLKFDPGASTFSVDVEIMGASV